MRVAIGAACIKNGQILLVRKGDSWILPGGKPEENESDLECLLREIKEELPKAQVKVLSFFSTIEGTTPYRGDTLQCKVYIADITGELTPDAEISEITWTADPFYPNLSEITRSIILKLQSEGYL